MYIVTCPSCNHPMRTAFARTGAVATCNRCKHQFEVQSDNLSREVKEGSGDALLDSTDAASEPAAAKPPGPAAKPPKKSARTRQPQTRAAPVAEVVNDAPPGKRSSIGSTIARRSAKRREKAMLIVLTGATVFTLLIVIAVLVVGLSTGGGALPAQPTGGAASAGGAQQPGGSGPDGGDTGTDTGSATPFADLVVADATTLPPAEWRRTSRPAMEEPASSVIQLANVDFRKIGDEIYFIADVEAQSFSTFESAEVIVELIDEDGNAIAECRRQIPLVGKDISQPLAIPTATDLFQRFVDFRWSCEPGPELPPTWPLQTVELESTGDGAGTRVRLAGVNKIGRPLDRTIFVVRGVNNLGFNLAMWKIEWTEMINPDGEFELVFETRLVPSWEIDQFDVVAVGVSSP